MIMASLQNRISQSKSAEKIVVAIGNSFETIKYCLVSLHLHLRIFGSFPSVEFGSSVGKDFCKTS